jgi:uncharacterized protein (DUF3820 family)
VTDQGNVVPFGKYKGRLVEELLIDDPSYLEWLAGQAWFRDKYVTLHQVIINRGAEPEETPDHNALQVLFLEDDFCRAFLRLLQPLIGEKEPLKIKRTFEERGIDVVLSACSPWRDNELWEQYESRFALLGEALLQPLRRINVVWLAICRRDQAHRRRRLSCRASADEGERQRCAVP